MPEQQLQQGVLREARQRTAPPTIAWRRLYVFGGTAGMTLLAAWMMWRVLARGGLNVLEASLLGLFVLLFAWISLSFLATLAGFVALLRSRRKLGVSTGGALPVLRTRTALLMPTYNEDPRRMMAGLQAIYESVQATGQLGHFDFFILSDTTRQAVGEDEERVFLGLREALGTASNLFYRRRADNTGRKAGNVADWVRRFGGTYPQMLILDADSLMTGEVIVRLTAAMEQHPDVGLIQSLPAVVNGRTAFARMQQFAGRVYGPVMAFGVAWWHGAESNYWGHNAVIRTRAFADHAGLPELPGRKPFAGHILSHDFVEAALLRRGGWATHMVPYLQGSYEEGPPTLTDLLVRDRRWCQGNLQHSKVIGAKGLHWVSRVHMAIGIGHYFTSPMWAMLLLVGMAIPLLQGGVDLTAGVSLPLAPGPYWHHNEQEEMVGLFVLSMALLLAPKLMGYLATVLRPADRRGFGGALRVAAGMALETVLAALMAPVVMYVQSRGVAEVLAGKDSGWDAQQRDDGQVSWSGLLQSYGGVSVFGAAMGLLAWVISPSLALWMSPVIVGMVLAVPVVGLTSSRKWGQWLRRHGLLSIPEEHSPPPVLLRAAELRAACAAHVPSS
jgi:membrane glycosyltransferase